MSLDWDKLRVFHAVARAGSFTRAGELLHLSQSAVSRQVGGLEQSLGCTLFNRHARGLVLTEQGELLMRTTQDVFGRLSAIQKLLGDLQGRPQGPLRITTTVALGSLWLTPRIHSFLELYPDIQVTLLTWDAELDLAMREADCAIRLAPPRHPDMVRRRLMQVHTHVFAAPSYITKYGMPQTPADLDRHRLIVFGDESVARPPAPNVNWLLDAGADGDARRPVLTVNNVYGIFRAVESGLGIAALPDFLAVESSNLVRVLPELEGPANYAYFIYPQALRDSRRIAAFREFLLREVEETPF